MKKMLVLSTVIFGFTTQVFAQKTILDCKAKTPSAAFTSIKLVREDVVSGTDMALGRSVIFVSPFSGKDEVTSKVISVVSTPTGMKTLFIDDEQMKVSLFQSQSDVALILESKLQQGDFSGPLIEFLKCTK